jgi:hypothetical protein
MWYDSVGHGHVPALRCAIESFGADRLVLGTDFPYEAGDVFVWAIDYIRDPQIDPTRTPSSTAMRWRCSRWRTAGAPRPPRDSATLGRDPPSTAQLLDGRPTRYLATISDYSGQGSVK